MSNFLITKGEGNKNFRKGGVLPRYKFSFYNGLANSRFHTLLFSITVLLRHRRLLFGSSESREGLVLPLLIQ